ncbi:related to SEC8 - protein transport protein [Ustilago trichophora]|uniref:Exocyst complex component Sec8 n=1 Tax=Ustilago trichophora TaxID=86804 RepID=A0A5C3E646_9BASI|nr:related to SEC8 - protein transport protein [Ustilago trichophora]
MSGRSNTIKDLRSKIKHENANLGSGTANSSFSSARHQIPHVGEAFGYHPGSASLGSGGTGSGPGASLAPSAYNHPGSGAGAGASGLGAGPSFVSLAPSDSISNYEGRQGHGYSAPVSHQQGGNQVGASYGQSQQHQQQQQGGVYGRSSSPTNQSTASFALDPGYSMPASNAATAMSHSRTPSRLDANDPTLHSPLRPARSVRRPTQAPELQKGLAAMSITSTTQDRARGPPQRPQLQIPPIGSTSRPAAGSPSSPARSGPGRDLLAASRSQAASHARDPSAQSTGAASLSPHATPPSDRHMRSAQLMAQVARSGTPSSQPDSEDHEDLYGGLSPVDAPSEGHDAALYSNQPSSNRLSVPGQRPQRDPRRRSGAPLGSLTESSQPAALDSVLSALTSAGRKRQAARIMRGTTAEEESRRRRNEKKISETSQVRKPITSYIDRSDPRAFQSINAVLRKVEAEWPFVANDHFNSVALALSMLDESSLGASRFEFDQVKQLIETALQGTVDDHYESFATAITMHNSVLQSLTSAQTSVSGARRRLRDSREALGAKRADLVQMWQRSQAVKEALRLLDLVEHLKSVPDRLESLMAEKRFLESVNLLVRSLKTIDKPEVVEVGATNDLRAYLKGQEQAMLEILIEELHNHLYLKSYFCDARWKVYSPGQEDLPIVKFGSDYQGVSATSKIVGEAENAIEGGAATSSTETLQLTRFLQSLRSRPSFDPNLASDIPESALMTATKSFSALTGELKSGGSSMDAGSTDLSSSSNSSSSTGGRYGAEFDANPEADSFLYIEMLLESLSRLGKLGTALDIISQRLAMEVHQVVDATIDEVDARNEPLRRFSVALRPDSVLLASSSALARSFTESMRSSSSRSSFNIANRPQSSTTNTSMLRISAGETSALQRDGETMRDLFWTLFSKLDAVLQGHRVVYEVAGMIASRAGFKDEIASKKLSGVGSLLEVWKPIQAEVRTLLHDYLMDDEGGSSARNAVISVNDVLRDHRFGRDRGKQLFKLADPGVKRPLGRREVGGLQRHQLAVTQALKASVPGLVSSIDTAAAAAAAALNGGGRSVGNQIIVSSSSSGALGGTTAPLTTSSNARGTRGAVDTYPGASHRLLVKPDAFNVSILFQPALSFLSRVTAIMPSSAAGETSLIFSAFLDEFVQDVFLPRLEEKVSFLFTNATSSHTDSFIEDPASRFQLGKPVVKSASNVIVLIDSLYSMLRTTPFHRESYSRLIVTVVIQYYQRCRERFRELVTLSEGGEGSDDEAKVNDGIGAIALSATWAQRPEMASCLAEMRSLETSTQRKAELLAQETRFELAYARAKGQPIAVHEHTTSRKKLMALGCLQHSIEWFAASIGRLKPVHEAKAENMAREKRAKARLSVMLDSPTIVLASDSDTTEKEQANGGENQEDLPLPLTPDLVNRYPTLSAIYHTLSSTILDTLRLEVRLRIITYLTLAITESTYAVNDTAIEPAPHIVDLNADLANLDDIFTETLPPDSRLFVLDGVAMLMDATLIGLVHEKQDGSKQVLKELQTILNLALGIEHSSKTPNSTSGDKIGLVQPNAGTLGFSEVSRQKLNEYLIELHEIAGENDSSDDDE